MRSWREKNYAKLEIMENSESQRLRERKCERKDTGSVMKHLKRTQKGAEKTLLKDKATREDGEKKHTRAGRPEVRIGRRRQDWS